MSHSLRKIFVITVAVSVCGCVATRRVGELAGKAALATPAFLAEGLWNGIFEDDDESLSERMAKRERKEKVDAEWKQFWISNPNVNPTMTEAFSEKRK